MKHCFDKLRLVRKVVREVRGKFSVSCLVEQLDSFHLCVERVRKFEENETERKDVNFVTISLARHLLRRHVELGADLLGVSQSGDASTARRHGECGLTT